MTVVSLEGRRAEKAVSTGKLTADLAARVECGQLTVRQAEFLALYERLYPDEQAMLRHMLAFKPESEQPDA